MIRVQLFGAVHVARADGADAGALLAQPKRLALLAYLAVSANTFHRRDSLLAVFWPELDQFAARRALRNTLYQLRLALGDDLFSTRGDEEVMIDGTKAWCDVVALREAVAAGRFDEAVALYRGELLDGFHVSNVGEAFEEWLERERARARDAARMARAERLRTAPPATTVVAPVPPPPGTERRRSRWALIGAAAVAVIVATAWMARPKPSVHKGRVIITVFENRTGDPRFDPVGDMMVDWVTRSIVQTHLVDVVDPRVLFTRGRTPDGQPVEPIALARRNGASTIVSGSYYRSGDSVLFIASIVDVPTANVIRSVGPLAASIERPTDGVEATRSRVLTSLASVLDPRFAAAWNAAVAPPPYEAYSPYIAGVSQFWSGNPVRAESLFALAVSHDTTFAAASIALAIAAGNMGDCATADSIAGAPRLHRRPLEPLDALALKIAIAHCHGRNEELLRLVMERSRLIPSSSPMQIGTANAELWANRPGLAVEALRGLNPATDLDWMPDSGHVVYWRSLCEGYHQLGQYDSELVVARRQSSRVTLHRIFDDIRALAGLRRPAEVLRELDTSFVLPAAVSPDLTGGLAPNTYGRPELTGTPAVVGMFATRELLVHGDTSAAREAAASTVAWIDRRPTSERTSMEYRAYKVWLLEAQGSLTPAILVAHGLVAEDTGNVDFRGTLGGLAAATGDTATARRTDAWLASLPADRGQWGSSFYRARIAVLLGRLDDGAALVRESFERGAWPYFLHTDPILHRLAEFKATTR